ncbi:peptidoglycan-binding protein [Limnohabitans sp. MMS-10A-160]|nr:peptidoglycan-binding protein [Limnohabitans sp. MMS-10A-192]PUE22793.1 peptidoglycan-binding protein [Limnohabitans sp. MMS-10A-160]
MMLILALTACSTPMDARKDAAFQSYGHAADRPTQRPMRSMSSFSDSLQCMDRLMRDAQIPTTLITSKQIPDFSTRVPVATKDMVITALLQMSRLSNAFRYVDYEVDIARQDTVQNLTNILLNNNQIQLQRPALYVSGSVAFVDQNVLNNRFDAGTSGARFETGYSQNRTVTIIGLELHLGDFRTRTMIPGLDSANEVIISNGGQGLDLAGRIRDYGWQFNVGRDYAQGSGAAVRTLVELAMIELTGKWARVPYWQCLTMEQTHPNFQRQLRDWYDEGNIGIHEALIRQSLVSKGYLSSSNVQPPSLTTFRTALSKFQADNGMVVTGTVDFSTYERALRDYVALNAQGQLIRYGWLSTSADPKALSANEKLSPTISEKVYGVNELPRSIDLQIENILMGRKQFEVGEQVFLSLTVSRQSHLACYLSNASGQVMRLLPNPVTPQAQISANQAIRLPDWMSPNPGYVIETSGAGTEGLLCMATDKDVSNELSEPLNGPALRPLTGIRDLPDVLALYNRALGTEGYTSATVTWDVSARKAPTTSSATAAPSAAASTKR